MVNEGLRKLSNLCIIVPLTNSTGHYKKYYDGTLELYSDVPNAWASGEPILNFEVPFAYIQGATITLHNADKPLYMDEWGYSPRIMELTTSLIKLKRAHNLSSNIYIQVWGRWK